jgi:hypothetical protein
MIDRSFYDECRKADQLLAALGEAGVDRGLLLRAAAACVRLVIDQAEGPHAERVLALACDGADAETLREAADALRGAIEQTRDPASKAAGYAALGLATGELASVPEMVADCAERSSMECGVEVARRWAEDKCMRIVRETIPWSALEARVSGS